jgi:hypothetical protein
VSLHVHVTTAPQWIPLSERKPTEADGDDTGCVWVLFGDGSKFRYHFGYVVSGSLIAPTHWAPIAKCPPLPKPKERTQKEKDTEKFDEIQERDTEYPEDAHDFANWARAEERKRFAAECLDEVNLVYIAEYLEKGTHTNLPAGLRALHKLLTEAAK